MYKSLPYKTKQFFFVLIKLSIVVGAFYFIYNKLINNETLDFRVFIDFLTKNDTFSTKNVIFLFFLSVFNWFLEIVKWRILVQEIKNISFLNSLKQCLGALTASLFTPNRIGEYGAKAIYYKKTFRKKIMLLNLLSNMTQMSVTTIFGIIGFIFFTSRYEIDIAYLRIFKFVMVLLLVSVFSILGIKKSKLRIKGNSISRIKQFISNISVFTHAKSYLLSICRYMVFSFQFYFLLTIFGVDVSYFNAMIVITSMYLLSSIIPSVFIFDVVIKGSIAVYLFSIVEVNDLTILSIVTLMWSLNFVLPSIFGSYFVINFNFPKEENI